MQIMTETVYWHQEKGYPVLYFPNIALNIYIYIKLHAAHAVFNVFLKKKKKNSADPAD